MYMDHNNTNEESTLVMNA